MLCEHLDRSGADTENEIALPLFQKQIGAIIGLHLMQVNRSFKELERDGLLTSAGLRTFRMDVAALRHAGEYTGDYLG